MSQSNYRDAVEVEAATLSSIYSFCNSDSFLNDKRGRVVRCSILPQVNALERVAR
ncbi:hypothetical protein Plhal703r1_c78g0173501 [Plasmopara halstedii]